MIGTLIVFGVTMVLAYWVWYRRNLQQLRDRLGIPGPPPSFWYGNLDLFAKPDEERIRNFIGMREQYGDTYGMYVGSRLTVILHDLDMVKEVLIKQFNNFVDRMEFPLMDEKSVVSQGITSLKQEEWRRVRNAVTPVFSSGKLKQMSKIISEKDDIFVEQMSKKADSEEVFDIYTSFQALTLDVIGRAAFAFDTNCQRDSEDVFLKLCTEFFNKLDLNDSKVTLLALNTTELPFWSKLRFLAPFATAENILIEKLKTVLNQRRRTFESFKGVDVLQILLQQQKDQQSENSAMNGCPVAGHVAGIDDKMILANCLIFLLAGYETTSTALGFSAWCLATNPDVQKRLQEEIDNKLESRNGGELDYDDLMKGMPYLNAVFHESLRLFPPVPGFVVRTCIKECVVNGVSFLPGMEAYIPVFAIHRDPNNWQNPDSFDPERFLNTSFNPMAWQPFGAGPRNCIGLRFAELEYKMNLTSLLAYFNIHPTEEIKESLPLSNPGVLMRPKYGVKVTVTHRKK